MYDSAKIRARRSGITFSITVEDVRAVWPRDDRCPVLRIPLKAGSGAPHDGSPTLDRLDARLGYGPGNLAVISYRANRAKSNCTAKELERIAKWMRAQGLD